MLGGGGEWYVAWYCGFFHGLLEQDVDAAALAEMIVGTSAGSYIGSSMASGHFQRIRAEFDFFGYFPGLFARMAPVSNPNTSQQRAQKINAAAEDGSIATRQIIGHAALAADNQVNGPALERVAAFLTGDSRPIGRRRRCIRRPSTATRANVSSFRSRPRARTPFHWRTVQRRVLRCPASWGRRCSVSATAWMAACAPTRRTSTWSPVPSALWSSRSIDGLQPPFLTGIPHPVAENIRQIEATGTKTMWIKADPPDVDLLDPKEILPALHTRARARQAGGCCGARLLGLRRS